MIGTKFTKVNFITKEKGLASIARAEKIKNSIDSKEIIYRYCIQYIHR